MTAAHPERLVRVGSLATDLDQVAQIVAGVVADEWEQGHAIAADDADLAVAPRFASFIKSWSGQQVPSSPHWLWPVLLGANSSKNVGKVPSTPNAMSTSAMISARRVS